MGQTEQPGDSEAEQHPKAGEPGADAPAPAGEPDADAETTVLPAGAGTPARGTAAPLGTLGEGRYRLTRKLGRGGMAEVFAAQDVRLGRTVAVKLLRPELAQDDTARLRFTREAHSVASLNHHSIVAVYDTGEEHGEDGETTPYIVMELVEGRTVRELLVDEEAPPVDQALIITAGVLEALSYSHRHGIVHRDIKPANVIITTTGAVKVMDFGIARALTGAASTMTQTGMVMGTPQYLSPEQALGKSVDHRSDLYAAGCMLYELLTLRPPFTGDTPLSVVYQHVQDAPVQPSRANDRVPPQLDALVLRALEKNPDDRFQTADEFRAHLQHALREMHGTGGAGYATGAAAAAAAAGLAAAASGNTGNYPGFEGPPSGGTSVTEPFGAVGRTGPTEAMPYQVTSPYRTPAQPYPGVSGPGGGDTGGPGHGGGGGNGGGDGSKRRNPWGWALGVIAVLLAATVGIALALTNSDKPTTPPVTPQPTVTVTSTPSTPSERPTTQAPTRSQSTNRPTEQQTFIPSPSASRSASPSASASASASPSSSSSPSHAPTPSTSPSAPATTAAPPTKGTTSG
ncbi:protein kinase domain-containing protein [Kitasatospora cinereorecta]|uniref:non-specific serine/threonine protein kinase n=1 Tax=Kitasatospora cinereorecta TaxID=285560 RepID=A0ABW0VP71_9ACTN